MNRIRARLLASAAVFLIVLIGATSAAAADIASMYRFYNSSVGCYLLTPSVAERDSYISNPRGYVYQGVAFTADQANTANSTPLYQFTYLARGTHFYTTNVAERDAVIANLPSVYRYDGIAFNVCPTSTGATPVYRFYFKNNGTHFFTTSETEKTLLQSNPSYSYEGIGFYVVSATPPPDTTPPTVSITSPGAGVTVSGSVALAASASDDVGVARVEFMVDGTLLLSDTTSPYSATWDASLATPGMHTIQATAYDAAGNTSSASVQVTVTSPPTGSVSMYRFYNASFGCYLLTPSVTERDSYLSDPRGYVYEGVAFTADQANAANSAPLYQFTYLARGTHFYTINTAERDAVIANLASVYRYDGAVFDVSPTSAGAAPVYRFYLRNGTHFFTASETEKTTLQTTYGYTYEGVGFYVASGAPPADTAPPTVSITYPTNGSNVAGLVTIIAAAADPESGVSRVEFRVDGVLVGTDSIAPYSADWDTTGAAVGTHVIQATAYDVAGNSASASVNVNIPGPDTIPPTVSIVTPVDGDVVSGMVYIGASAGDSGGSGMSRVEFFVDGALVGTSYQHMWVAEWDSTGAAPGAHTIQATAYDLAGNSATASITVWIAPPDTTPPTVSISSPVDGSTVSGTVTLAATAADTDSGVARVEFRVDGVLIASDTTEPYSTAWNASTASPGTHVIEATAFDASGNSAGASISVTVEAPPPDTTPPTVSITSPANGATVWSSVSIAAEAADSGSGVGGVQFLVDGLLIFSDTTWPYSAVWDATGASLGTHTITASAYDLAGNTAVATVQVTVAAPPSVGAFVNDFSLGEPLNTAYLGTYTSDGGTAVIGDGKLTLSTSADAASSICYFLESVAKGQAKRYEAKFRVTSAPQSTNLGVLSLHAGSSPPSANAFRLLDASWVTAGATNGLQLSRMGTDGVRKYYNWANQTWGTTVTKFSLQPNVTYIVRLETNTASQFRYVVCSSSGVPLVNGTSIWTAFSSVYNNSSNSYWPYLGDAFTTNYSGTMEIFSISRQ